MTTVEKMVDVGVPVSAAYNQWTQFESFPRFMEGVDEVTQRDDTHMHWRTSIAGIEREFDAVITEQEPDLRVAWRTTDGPFHAGVATFHRLDDDNSRVNLQMDYTPESMTEKAGTSLGLVEKRVEGDLERFKQFIESQGEATGAWRGEVPRRTQHGE